jgi:Pyridoxal-phosphate dependent enzyme
MAGPAAQPSAVTLTPEGCSSADTAWAGCEQVPAWIVQGYQTLLDEIDTQLGGTPDLVAVPVGVGSLAEAVVRHYRRPGAAHPSVLSVEPDTAACALASLTAARATTVATAATVMTGSTAAPFPAPHGRSCAPAATRPSPSATRTRSASGILLRRSADRST